MTQIASPDYTNYDYFRIVGLTEVDKHGYYIGFATKCVCGKPPLPCMCSPKLIRGNGTESGDIFFDCRSCEGESSPSFEEMSKIVKTYPIFMGKEGFDTGKNEGKKILKWVLPTKPIESERKPKIVQKFATKLRNMDDNANQIDDTIPNTFSSNTTLHPKFILMKEYFPSLPKKLDPKSPEFMPNSHTHDSSDSSYASVTKTGKVSSRTVLKSLNNFESEKDNAYNAYNAYNVCEDDNNLSWSVYSGVFTPSTWKSDETWTSISSFFNFPDSFEFTSLEDMHEISKDSRLHKWVSKYVIDSPLCGLDPPLCTMFLPKIESKWGNDHK